MARKKNRGKARAKRISKRQRRRSMLQGYNNGFVNSPDNPFTNTPAMKNASKDSKTRMQRRLISDTARRNTFSTKYNITKGYDALTSVLGSAVYQMIKETTQFDSHQLIDLIKRFDQGLDPTIIEQALLNYMDELTLPTYVEIDAIQEAIDAGFDIEDAVEYAELIRADLGESMISSESAYVNITDIINDILAELRANGML